MAHIPEKNIEDYPLEALPEFDIEEDIKEIETEFNMEYIQKFRSRIDKISTGIISRNDSKYNIKKEITNHDIYLICSQTNSSREVAERCLTATEGDVIDAILLIHTEEKNNSKSH
jgi:NACalpha-BTF3-like transcription factor